MENLIKLQKAGFLIRRLDYAVSRSFCFCETFGLFNVDGEACGLLQVSLDEPLSHDLSEKEFRNHLFDVGDSVDSDCEITAVEIYQKFKSDQNFMNDLRGVSYWSHVDYCFVSKECRGQGLGALFLLAYVEGFAPSRIITAIPELKSAKLIEYWQKVAGFQPFNPLKHGGPIFMFSPNDSSLDCVERLGELMMSHKREAHGVISDDDGAEWLSKR